MPTALGDALRSKAVGSCTSCVCELLDQMPACVEGLAAAAAARAREHVVMICDATHGEPLLPGHVNATRIRLPSAAAAMRAALRRRAIGPRANRVPAFHSLT